MAISKHLLDIDCLKEHLVQIMTKNSIIDKESGKQQTYAHTAYLKGCDGMFVYYSFISDGEISGCIPVSEVMDIVRLDHIEDMMQEAEDV